MSTVLRPVGPQPERVYWIRRLAVLAACVVVGALLGIVWSLVSGGPGDAAEPGTAGVDVAEGVTDDVAAAPEGASSGPVACTAAEIALVLTSNARSYPAPGQPVLSVAITNVGTASCTLDAADAAREIVITSGSDRIWSSADCPAEAAPTPLLLDPGARWAVDVTWPRARSAEGCALGLAEPRPGTYTAAVSWLGATSDPVVFDLS